MLRGHLKIVVLKALAESPKSGYSLMKFIEEKIGVKPSSGSMYPLLDSLKQNNLVSVTKKGRSNEYSLTSQGKEHLSIINEKKSECISQMEESMNMISTLTDEDMNMHKVIIEMMKKGEVPFKELNPELNKFRTFLFKMAKEGSLKKNSSKIKKILAKVNEEMKKL
jgi:formylmethanofuran dehydrogenase subunit E